MGWERKRGKLHELNRLLRGATDTTFMPTDGRPPAVPAGVRYVITLDADTRLPRDTVRRLIGKMAHPLNQPRFDLAAGRVVEGYAVLQPRVTPSLPVGREGSLFQRVFSESERHRSLRVRRLRRLPGSVRRRLLHRQGHLRRRCVRGGARRPRARERRSSATICSRACSRAPVLLPTSRWSRSFPPATMSPPLRHHRWARGDWQLLPWIFGRGRSSDGHQTQLAMPAIGRWKMLDNLRRTLSAPAAVLRLAGRLDAAVDAAAVWTGFVLATIVLPSLHPARRGRRAAPARDYRAQPPCARSAHDLRLALAAIRARGDVPGASGVVDGRCNRANLVRLVRHPTTSARMDLRQPRQRLVRNSIFSAFIAGWPVAVVIGLLAVFVGWAAGQGTWAVGGRRSRLLWTASPAVARWVSRSPLFAGRLSVSRDRRASAYA